MAKRPHRAAPRNLYGRARHRRLSPSRRSALQDIGPLVRISGVSMAENPERKPLAPEELSGGRQERWLEIGFGTGEHLLALARDRPEIAMIGAEPYVAGVSRLLATARHCVPDNLRVHAGDGRDLLDVIPDHFLNRVFLLYPDPWPKRRHARRRFISRENLDALARTMRPGSELRVATDIPSVARHCLLEARRHAVFAWTAERPADWRRPWPGWVGTRYEQKALAAGRQPIYLTLARTGANARTQPA